MATILPSPDTEGCTAAAELPALDLAGGFVMAVDKPLGWTSFNAVKKLRSAMLSRLRRHGIRKLKVGHAGTLDPLASGVMIICFGRATKKIDLLQSGVKEYIAKIRLGATTPSFDLETEIDATYPTAHITREAVSNILPQFTGTISQVPPAFSACKVDGKRAYSLARKGKEVELKPKTLVIDSLEILDFSDAPDCMELTLKVVCSKGTYIRALARDIGAALGSGAHLTGLRRTRVGLYAEPDILDIEAATDIILRSPVIVPDGDGPDSPDNSQKNQQ